MDVGWQTGFEHWTIHMWLMWHRTWTPKIKHDSGTMWNHFFPEVPLEASFANWSNVSSGANKWGHWFRHKNTSDALQAQFVKCALSLLDDDCSQRPGFSWVRWKVSVSQIHEKRTCSGSGCHRGIQSSASLPTSSSLGLAHKSTGMLFVSDVHPFSNVIWTLDIFMVQHLAPSLVKQALLQLSHSNSTMQPGFETQDNTWHLHLVITFYSSHEDKLWRLNVFLSVGWEIIKQLLGLWFSPRPFYAISSQFSHYCI